MLKKILNDLKNFFLPFVRKKHEREQLELVFPEKLKKLCLLHGLDLYHCKDYIDFDGIKLHYFKNEYIISLNKRKLSKNILNSLINSMPHTYEFASIFTDSNCILYYRMTDLDLAKSFISNILKIKYNIEV